MLVPKSDMKRLREEKRRRKFTVAIFGSARIRQNDPSYRRVYRLGKWIGAKGFDVVTGGGPGLMDAASKGHQEGRKSLGARSVGLNIILPREQKANRHLDIKTEFPRFSERLDTFMFLANVVVVGPGGIGTLLELLYAWQLIQVRDVDDVPIILIGDMWPELVDWVRRWPLRRRLLSQADLDHLLLVRDIPEAMRIIEAAYDAYKRKRKLSSRDLKNAIAPSSSAGRRRGRGRHRN